VVFGKIWSRRGVFSPINKIHDTQQVYNLAFTRNLNLGETVRFRVLVEERTPWFGDGFVGKETMRESWK